MKFPLLFKRERSKEAQLEAQAELEKVVAESFRVLGNLFTRAAELIEAQRLQKQGFERQERFLERLDKPGSPNK